MRRVDLARKSRIHDSRDGLECVSGNCLRHQDHMIEVEDGGLVGGVGDDHPVKKLTMGLVRGWEFGQKADGG